MRRPTAIDLLLATTGLFRLGLGMEHLAAVYFAYQSTGTLLAAAMVAAAYTASYRVSTSLLLPRTPITRADPRLVVATCLSLHAVLTGLLGALAWTGLVDLAVLLAVTAGYGVLSGVEFPTTMALRRSFGSPDHLLRNQAWFRTVGGAAAALGAFLGGLVVHGLGQATGWALAVVPLVAAVVPIGFVPSVSSPLPPSEPAAVVDGGRTAEAWLRATLVLAIVLGAATASVTKVLPDVAALFGSSSVWLGTLTAGSVLGGVLLVPASDRLQEERSVRTVLAVALPTMALLVVVVALTDLHRSLVGAMVALVVFGFLSALTSSMLLAVVQGHSATEDLTFNLGRFTSTRTTSSFAAGLGAALLADRFGTPAVLFGVGAALVVMTAVALGRWGRDLPASVCIDTLAAPPVDQPRGGSP